MSEPAIVRPLPPPTPAPLPAASPLSTDLLGQPFQARTAVLAQIGWVGNVAHHVYGLADPPYDGREPAGYLPLYIHLGDHPTNHPTDIEVWS